jgi:hypothetical protein
MFAIIYASLAEFGIMGQRQLRFNVCFGIALNPVNQCIQFGQNGGHDIGSFRLVD